MRPMGVEVQPPGAGWTGRTISRTIESWCTLNSVHLNCLLWLLSNSHLKTGDISLDATHHKVATSQNQNFSLGGTLGIYLLQLLMYSWGNQGPGRSRWWTIR